MTLISECCYLLFSHDHIFLCFDVVDTYIISLCSAALSVSFTSSVCLLWIHYFLTRANVWAGVATFQCSDTVVFVFVFTIPVCLDPCDPVDCGNSVPPCHSEPVWRNDLVSRTQTDQKKPALLSLTTAAHVSSQVCSHCYGAFHIGF